MTATIKLDAQKLLGYAGASKLSGAKVGNTKKPAGAKVGTTKRAGAKVGVEKGPRLQASD